ncbi:FAD binding domain-containing protein [Actinocrispum wychmicini]|uniref:Carbon-monoxide dehydrogenase medium subunit n=1 Tax=Actinocrispum wychmicini TaxID=1213861 RepID=A0A4V2S8Q1_9PSEU|nr:xanthine dehydrogenase family protein subunit M [Actinocrispum wychmicini]TCO64810.1 carbon-monoxide dehydrogenase medium subunit [Actinocrispum wychmicini]
MKPAAFTYHRAYDVNETIALLGELGPDAKILAGGQSLVAMMNFRLARPSALVDITRIAGLDYQRRDGDGLHIGALTTHRAVEKAKLDGFAVLPKAARWIGHYPIRCRGTFGGSIAHGDATSEWCVLAVLLEAVIVLQGPTGQREVPATEFFHGFFMTATEPDEMVVEIRFPRPAPHAALTEFSQRKGDFAVVAAAARLDLANDEVLTSRIVLGGVGPKPVVVDADLAGRPATEDTWRAAGEAAAAQVDPPSDGHGSSAYRKKLTATLVARALAEAAA